MKFSTAEEEAIAQLTTKQVSDSLGTWEWELASEEDQLSTTWQLWRKMINGALYSLYIPTLKSHNFECAMQRLITDFSRSEDLSTFEAIAFLSGGKIPLNGGCYMEYDETKDSFELRV